MPLAVEHVNRDENLLPGKILEYYAINIATDGPISAQTIK